jgi:polysaccharide chain length determinant protein (PEP-CTERM system associated)
MADETRKGPDLERLLAVWRRRKWLAILSFAALFSATATVTMCLPSTYQSIATVLVVGQQVPVEFVRSTVTGAVDSRLQTISQEILSRSRLEELIARFGLYPQLRNTPTEARLGRMRRDIEVKPTGLDRAGGTVAFTIRYRGRDPETVALVANTLASYYIEENMKVRERQATGTAQFLRAQLEEVKKRLELQERRVSDFRRRNLGELPSQMEANLSTLERLNTQFRVDNERLIRARDQRQELARLVDSMAVPGPTARATVPTASGTLALSPPDPLLVRLKSMKQDLHDLRTRFSDRYPDVAQLKAEIAALERQVAEANREKAARDNARREGASAVSHSAPAEAAPPADPQRVQLQQSLTQLDAEIRSLQDEERNLRDAMATYQARVENTPRRDLEFQELSRDYDSTKDLYRTLLKRYEEAQLSENLEQRQKAEQFRILEPAVTPTVPASPDRFRFLILSLCLSVGVAVGMMVLAEYLDKSFHTIEDLRAFANAPVVLSLPLIVTAADIRRRRWRAALTGLAAAFSLALIVGASYFVARGNEQLLRLLTPGQS